MTPATDKSTDPIGSLTPAQVLAVVTVLADQARSHGSNFERASGVAHAALDVAVTWIAHQ